MRERGSKIRIENPLVRVDEIAHAADVAERDAFADQKRARLRIVDEKR